MSKMFLFAFSFVWSMSAFATSVSTEIKLQDGPRGIVTTAGLSNIQIFWSADGYSRGSLYTNNADDGVVVAKSNTRDICKLSDASQLKYFGRKDENRSWIPHVRAVADDIVVFHNTKTNGYAAVIVKSIYTPNVPFNNDEWLKSTMTGVLVVQDSPNFSTLCPEK